MPPTNSTFRDRLVVYLVGVAIGFTLLGLIWNMKARMTAPRPGVPGAVQSPATAPTSSSPPVPVPVPAAPAGP